VVCDQIRAADVIGRYGGDEFVILLPQSSAQEALRLAERIHSSVANIFLETEQGGLSLTISIGIAEMLHKKGIYPSRDTLEALFLRADQALYAAKHSGRNRTVMFE
jgi:diguanylate cyclase (GGDEF)-like protein